MLNTDVSEDSLFESNGERLVSRVPESGLVDFKQPKLWPLGHGNA